MKAFNWMGALTLAFALAACGGGGGSSGGSTAGSGTGTGTGTGAGTGTGTGTGTVVPGTATVTVEIKDATNATVTNISFGGSYLAQATLRDASGAAVANRAVSFSLTDTSIATLPSPATALTNGAGVAQISIAPASTSAKGATTLSATATITAGSPTVSGQTDFAVSSSNVTLSALSLGSATLSSGGNTSVSVTALLNGSPFTGVPVNVTFSASCGKLNNSGSSLGSTTNGSGVASVIYTAVQPDGTLCSGPVSLNASTPGTTASTATVTVSAPTANSIVFVSATPGQIYIAGIGAPEQSQVKFRVFSSTGTVLANVPVTFSLVVNPAGVGLGSTGSTAPITINSDAAGDVAVQLFSGTVPGPVRVRAELASNTAIFTESQNLTVASGPPSQRFMSLSVSTFNIEGNEIDGTLTSLTVRLADRQGNPVQDGTVVNFTAEGGQVVPSCATRITGGFSQCSVNFISQNPRPVGGRVSVLAFTEGTKDYVDNNGNNRYDTGDTLVNIGDAYRDDNENGAYDPGEFVVTRGGNQACTGAGEPFPARANTCDLLTSPTVLSTTVRQQTVILYASSTATFTNQVATRTGVSFKLRSAANPNLPMPAGTQVSATVSGGGANCAVVGITNSTIASVNPGNDPTADLSTSHVVSLDQCGAGTLVQIRATAPSGTVTPLSLTTP